MIFVAMGGAVGAVGRYLTVAGVGAVMGHGFPYGTLVVNILGSFILGVLVETMALKFSVSQEVRALLVVGMLGAFTTFSTFSLDVVVQLERGHLIPAAIYIITSVTFSVLALFAGLRLMRMVLT
ncbi:MAG: fluoride efflux transporter CrcB [Rhodospirillaceae bacterium]|nr:fluoride efflux transporter CrcB [Rhodospirillaceae bacterium]MBT6202494.1 fluoride efflux transporter CrcB [Rhodospirillaceae bacterium]MBT6512241.1 fluoride efflux transporter CrcB [Rhodospirillaceae bacterium]MBT7612827.1 fluoride efflux transporter CrcB [Rhodospirillaceae bacterium]MBT7647677.1 fluoride efflux transporter CrcB [Rhodospirillaceae bacterium]